MSDPQDTTATPTARLYEELVSLDSSARKARLAALRSEGEASQADELDRLLAAEQRPSLPWSALLRPVAESVMPGLPAGTRVGRFVIDGELGRGGMGVVYAGHRDDGTIAQEVAIKLSQLNEAEGATLGGLAREAALLSTLRHPGIAQFLDIVSLDNHCLAMVMERVTGVRLDRWLAGHTLDLPQVLQLLDAIGDALRYAHGRRVLHGDIKPANIMLDAQLQPRLLDFGIAVLMTHAGRQRAIGASPGTAAPEVTAQGLIDMRSDVYSFGKLGQLLLAQVPGAQGQPGRYSARADLQAVLDRATQQEPEQRYPDLSSVLIDLRAIADQRPISHSQGRPAYHAVRLMQRRPAMVGMGVTAILALLVAVIGISLALAREERQRLAAEQAQQAATERAAELEQVTQFQREQLSTVDAAAMGLGLREAIIAARVEAAANPDTADNVRSEVMLALQGVNFTNVALASMDKNIFARAVEAIDQSLDGKPLLQARLLMAVGQTYGELGLYAQAQPLGERVLEIYRNERGEDHPDTLAAARGLAMLLTGIGDVEAGGRLIRQVHARCESVLPENDRLRLAASFSMGDQLIAESERRAALALLEPTLARQIQVLGEGDRDTLKTMTSIFTAHFELGELEPAEAMATRRLDILRRTQGPNDLLTLRAMTDHQTILGEMGRTDAAVALGLEVLAIKRRVLGDAHHDTILSINNLGLTYANAMRLDEAEPLMREALERISTLFGPTHLHALNSASNLSFIYSGQGRQAEAEAANRVILRDARAVLGDEHPFTLRRINDLGVTLLHKGDLKEAEALMREALSAARRIDGDRHPMTLGKIANLGDLIRQVGQLEEADALGAESVATAREVLPGDHPDLARYRARHARTLLARQRYEQAQEQLLAAHPTILAAFGAEHRLTRQVVEDLVRLFEARQQQQPEASYGAEAERWRAHLPPAKPPAS